MHKISKILLTLSLGLSLTACKKKTDDKPPTYVTTTKKGDTTKKGGTTTSSGEVDKAYAYNVKYIENEYHPGNIVAGYTNYALYAIRPVIVITL